MKYKILNYILLIFVSLLLISCTKSYYTQARIMRLDSYYTQMFSERLGKLGVTVRQDQENLTVILPKSIFVYGSANFATTTPRLLDEVVHLLKYYDLEVVRVVGVNPDSAYGEKTLALAAERAHRVVQYLWAQDIDIGLAYAEGLLRSQVQADVPAEYVSLTLKNP